MASIHSRGRMIVFEGLDRAGKTTQSMALMTRLEDAGIKAEKIVFPDRTTPIGKMIDSYLKETKKSEMQPHVLHMLFAANRWEHDTRIKNLLEMGVWVIIDRYSFSGVAYSVGALGLDSEWCRGVERGLVEPDAVIFLDVGANICASRGDYGVERYEKVEIQTAVGKAYDEFRNEAYWKVIDANGTAKEVEDAVFLGVTPLLENENDFPQIRPLWREP